MADDPQASGPLDGGGRRASDPAGSRRDGVMDDEDSSFDGYDADAPETGRRRIERRASGAARTPGGESGRSR